MPTKNGRGLDEQGCFAPSWRDSRGENNREALPGRPPDAPGDLPLGDNELLSKKRVLGDQFDATANEIRGQSGNESKKIDHGSSLTPSARMEFVARTGSHLAQSHQPSSADDVRWPVFAARSPSLFPIERPDEHDLFELLEREISRRRYMPHQLLVPPGETHDRRRAFRLFLFLSRFFLSLSHHP